MDIASVYNPSNIESKWYSYWLSHNLFSSVPNQKPAYTVVIPPPNVTGVLHMGHMLNNTIQDILIRHARLKGFNACWVPGTDHASIATEAKVVGKLAEQGIKKDDLTREEFLKHAWDWTEKHGGIILEQLKRLGASCDWNRTAFTMDEARSESVIDVFCELYNAGLIYRGVRVVNWDPQARTALSDEEVVYQEVHGKLFYLRYYIEGSDNYIVVATTRPETIMGDTAVCINPNDPRYTHLKGKRVIVPLVGRSVPVIEDEYVDMEFGTGCLKVTPAHDINDYQLGIKHRLETIDIFNDNGTLNEQGGVYAGMDRFDVRKKIEQDLTDANLMERVEDYTNKVGYSERTHVAIEPKLSMQWFLKMEELSKPALNAVLSGEIKLIPNKFINTYRHWLENVKDWCVSRQLWWGHRIPAYYLPDGQIVVAASLEEALQKARLLSDGANLTAADLRQDEDSLDTWFSSWLWPLSLFGNAVQAPSEEAQYYYPTAVLVTGPDILFFWVARMIIAGYRYRQLPPFKDVYLTGIVRDDKGRKMSKSLGNSPDPLDLIDRYGADAVRMGLMMAAPAGNDLLYDESLIEQGRNFCNKVWNCFRLISTMKVDDNKQADEAALYATRWMEAKIASITCEIEDLYGKYRLSEAMMLLYKLFRDDFSSFFLEAIKPPYGEALDKETHRRTIEYMDYLLRLLHPFMPFITEELWQNLKQRSEGESIMYAELPDVYCKDSDLETEVEMARTIITQLRNIRNTHGLPSKELLTLYTTENHSQGTDHLILKLGGVERIDAQNKPEELVQKGSSRVSFIVGTTPYAVPMDGFIDTEALAQKLRDDLEHQKKFLIGVEKKLGNEKFMANAKPEVVALEQKKKQDALSRIADLEARLSEMQK